MAPGRPRGRIPLPHKGRGIGVEGNDVPGEAVVVEWPSPPKGFTRRIGLSYLPSHG